MGEFLVRHYGLTSVADEERLDPANTSDELQKLEQAARDAIGSFNNALGMAG